MKAAWHFSARNRFQNGFVPKGRYDSMWSVCSPGAERTPVAADHTVPYGGTFIAQIPRNKLPGCLHCVPTGQVFRPVCDPCFANRSQTSVKCCHAPMRGESYPRAFATLTFRFFDRAWGGSRFLWGGPRKRE